MPSTTVNYGLEIYNSSTDQSENFADWRIVDGGSSISPNKERVNCQYCGQFEKSFTNCSHCGGAVSKIK